MSSPPDSPRAPGTPTSEEPKPTRRAAAFRPLRPTTVVQTNAMHRAVWINRPFYGVVYRSLRQPGYRFWLEVFAAQIVIVLIGLFLLEVVARQDRGLGLDLALQAVGLSIQERQCGAHSDWCRRATERKSRPIGQRVQQVPRGGSQFWAARLRVGRLRGGHRARLPRRRPKAVAIRRKGRPDRR
mmetsp:Transcript_30605/g.91737  ORF Transcript_30605/g.91737 Transcript_30605/m.91737 type:complete len:184 (-) Transcript_30605:466-1017(-)